MQLDLGRRYLQKSKWHNYVLLEAPIPAPDHMAWVSLFTILEVAEMDHCLNADLRSLLSVFDWDKLAVRGVTAPVRTKSCALFSELACLRNAYRMDYEVVALEELVAWMVM